MSYDKGDYMKNIKMILFLVAFLVISLPLNVHAVAGVGGDYQGGSGSNMGGVSGNTNYPSPQVAGVRISFIKADGTSLASKDYILQEDLNVIRGWTVAATSQRCSRASYTSGKCQYSWTMGQSVASLAQSLNSFNSLFSVSGYSFPVNIMSAVANKNYTNAFDGLYKENTGLSDSAYQQYTTELFNNLLAEFGLGTIDDYEVPGESEKLYDLFLVFEPITVVRIEGVLYYGNSYELAKIAASRPSGSSGLAICRSSSMGALCDLAGVLSREVPCASYLDGNLYNSLVEKNSTVLIQSFSPNSYFSNSIQIVYANTSAVCAGRNFLSTSVVTGPYGVGMGVIWINDIFDGEGAGTKPPEEPEKTFNCTPKYNIGTCINGDSIQYYDSSQGVVSDEYWENCVFTDNGRYEITPHKESNKNANLTYYESQLGSSKFCEVYCIETLNATFSKPDVNVEAGRFFTWGYSNVEGSRTCKTKEVKWDEFTKELEDTNKNIKQAYVNWQLQINKQKGLNNAKKTISSSECSYVNNDGGIPNCIQAGHNSPSDCSGFKVGTAAYQNCLSQTKCIKSDPNNTRYDRTNYSWDGFSLSDGSVSASSGSSGWCSNETPHTANVAGAQASYNSYVQYAQYLIDEMKKCYTWDEEKIYKVDPKATIKYSDGINYTYEDELNSNITYFGVNDQSICVNDSVLQIKGCSGRSCPSTTIAMKNCGGDSRYVMMKRSASTSFLLKENVFRYILKSTHMSIHPDDLGKYSQSDFTTNFIDVGFSNFPVSFSAPAGKYGTNHGRGNYDVMYSNLGHVNGSSSTPVDSILSEVEGGNEYGKWICEYNVYTDLLPENPDNPDDPDDPDGGGGGGNNGGGNGDIDVVYRVIDLIDPFPDTDATNRNTGSNWCDNTGSCSYNNEVVRTYINNNRNVKDYEVYEQEPMYTLILTPKIIGAIRSYNDENNYDSYTGKLTSANKYMDFVCTKGTGRNCRSEFLDYLTGITSLTGTCMDSAYRSNMTNGTQQFESCRY